MQAYKFMNYQFNQYAKMVCEQPRKVKQIERIKVGEKYSDTFFRIDPAVAREDAISYKFDILGLFDGTYKAKQVRWCDCDFVGTQESMIQEWNHHITFRDDEAWLHSRLVITLVDGSTIPIYFSDWNELVRTENNISRAIAGGNTVNLTVYPLGCALEIIPIK